jgi:LysM repeat protein
LALSRELAGLEENMDEDRAGSTYLVKEGDTLSQIAEDAGTTVDELVALNGIENPDVIQAGRELKVKSDAAS